MAALWPCLLICLAVQARAQELRAVDYRWIAVPCLAHFNSCYSSSCCFNDGSYDCDRGQPQPVWETRCDYPVHPCVDVLVREEKSLSWGWGDAWANGLTLFSPSSQYFPSRSLFSVAARSSAPGYGWEACTPASLASSVAFEVTYQLFPTASDQSGAYGILLETQPSPVRTTAQVFAGGFASAQLHLEVRRDNGTLIYCADSSDGEVVDLPTTLVVLGIGEQITVQGSVSTTASAPAANTGGTAEAHIGLSMQVDPVPYCPNPAIAATFNTINAPLLSAAGAPASVPSGNTTWMLGVDCDAFGPGTIVILRLRSSCTEGEITPMGQILVAQDSPLSADLVSVYSGNSLPVTFGVTVPPAFCGRSLCAQALITPSPLGTPKIRRKPILTNAITAVTGHP